MSKDFRILIWLRRVIVIAFSLASFNFASATEPTFSQEGSEAPIRALHNQMIDAYNRGDATGASSAFAPDGALITGDGKRYVTPPEIQRYLKVLHAKLPKGILFVATVTDVRFAGHDTVILTSEGGWLYPGEGAVSDKNQGIQTFVALRHKGAWRAVLFQRTRRPAPGSNRTIASTALLKLANANDRPRASHGSLLPPNWVS
jgi:uncharacterized protein (TIGR02246 family)